MDFGFSDEMGKSLVKNRVYLVKNLIKLDAIMDHLIQEEVFIEGEEILGTGGRQDQARNLLSRLEKRPGRDFWKFIACLYNEDIRQEHIAEKILDTYTYLGGTIDDPRIQHLRQVYHNQQRQPPQQYPQQHQLNPSHQEHEHHLPHAEGDQPAFPVPVQCSGQNEEFRNVQQPQAAAVAAIAQPMETDIEVRGPAHNIPDPSPNGTGDAAGNLTKYEKAKRKDAGKVYKMESTPRGLALVINNQHFDNMDPRPGAECDLHSLEGMLENKLGFEMEVLIDQTAEQMLSAVKRFSKDPRLQNVDSAIIVIMSHGAGNGVIFGTDGQVNENGPVENTYIKDLKLRQLLAASCCPSLAGKPKLFIIQACRGGMKDTTPRSRQFGMDVVTEERRTVADYYDMCWLRPSVEGYVGYRGTLIPAVVAAFTEHADTKHFKDLATEVHSKMSEITLNDEQETHFPTSEESGSLKKKWYFNPPS